MKWGVLIFLKSRKDTSYTQFDLHPNQTYTIGTGSESNIRLKVQDAVPEFSILHTSSEGVTEFKSNGISDCQINHKPFQGARYLVPGDIVSLFNRQFRYENPSFGQETIEMLLQENRKLFCKNKLEDKSSNRRHTMVVKRNLLRSSVSSKGSKTPAPKSAYTLFANDFVEEDIENHPITPSKNNKTTIFNPVRKNIFSTPQCVRRRDDTNCFNFLQYQQINLNIGRSSTPNKARVQQERKDSDDDRPPDLIAFNSPSFKMEIRKSDEDATMLDDISDPFSSEQTPEGQSSLAILEKTNHSPAKTPKSILKNHRESKYNIEEDHREAMEENHDSDDIYILQETPSKQEPEIMNAAVSTPVNSEMNKTPKSGIKTNENNAELIEETPARITRRSASMTPRLHRIISNDNDGQLKTAKSVPKMLNRTANFVSTKSPSLKSSGRGNQSYNHPLVHKSLISEYISSPRRYSERLWKTERAKSAATTRRYSHTVDNPIKFNYASPEREENLENEENAPNLAILKNESFVTRRSARKTSCAPLKNHDDNINLGPLTYDVDSDTDLSTGSSFGHYESDKDVSQSTIEDSVLNATKKRKTSEGDQLDDMGSIKFLSDISTGSSSSHYCSDKNVSQLNVEDSMLNIAKKRRLSELNELTDMEGIKFISDLSTGSSSSHYYSDKENSGSNIEDSTQDINLTLTPSVEKRRISASNELMDEEGIKDLLNISPTPSRYSLNELTDEKGIQELLSSSPVRQDISKDFPQSPLKTPLKLNKTPMNNDFKEIKILSGTPKAQKLPNNDLSDIGGVKKLLATPKVPKSPMNDLTDVKGVKKILATPKVQNSPKNDLRDSKGLKNLLATPEVQKTPKNDLTDVEGVKQILATPRVQKTPKNDLTDVKGVKKILATRRVQKTPKNDLTDVKGVKKILATPRVQKPPKNDLADVKGVKKLLATPKIQKTPKNDLTDVKGVKKILATPRVQKPPKNDLTDIKGVKKILATPRVQKPPKNDLADVKGVKKLLATPKLQKPPKNDLTDIKGVKKLLATPKLQNPPENDLTDVKGVKKLLATPKAQKQPKNDLSDIRGVKKLLATPKTRKQPKNDLSDVRGVKKLLATPRQPQNPPKNDLNDVRGVKQLLSTPKGPQKLPNNDLSDVRGVKRLLATPKFQNPPNNDLTDVRGIKKLLATPKQSQKAPKNDLTDIKGVKKMFTTPKVQKVPLNDLSDLSGVENLMSTPKLPQKSILDDSECVVKESMATRKPKFSESGSNTTSDVEILPESDLADVNEDETEKEVSKPKGVKRLKTKHNQKSPLNDLTNVRGVKDLFRVLENKSNNEDEVNFDGLKELFEAGNSSDDSRDPFDKLINKKSYKTYKGKSLSPQNPKLSPPNDVTPTVLEWLEGQDVHLQNKDVLSNQEKQSTECGNEIDAGGEKLEETKKRPARQTRRNRKDNGNVQEKEITSPKNLNTRSRRTRKQDDGNKTEEDASSKVRTRARSKNLAVNTEDADNKEEEVMPVRTRSTRRNKKSEKETHENEMKIEEPKEEMPKRSTRGKRVAKDISPERNIEEQQTSTPVKTRGRNAKKRTLKDAEISITEEATPTKPVTTRRGRKKKTDDNPIIVLDNTPLNETNTSEKVVTNVRSTSKKPLFNLDLYSESELNRSKEIQQDAQQPVRTLRSNRIVNLPKMLDGYEVNIKRKSGELKASPATRPANKRKVPAKEVDPEPVMEIRRSKRTRK